jgi:hypothetical protein
MEFGKSHPVVLSPVYLSLSPFLACNEVGVCVSERIFGETPRERKREGVRVESPVFSERVEQVTK